MAGPVIAGVLPPLLPTPTTATSCISLRPPLAPYASKKPAAMAGPVVAAGLPPLLPTPTSCVGLTPPPASYASVRLLHRIGRYIHSNLISKQEHLQKLSKESKNGGGRKENREF